MKNNKTKLARNAARLRKARNKRADGQGSPKKPKSHKRLLARICALFGCLVLVSALVVPCFAAQPDSAAVTFDEMRYNYGVSRDNSYFERFGANNFAFAKFRGLYQSWFEYAEDYSVFTSGNVQLISTFPPSDYSFGNISEGSEGSRFDIMINDVDVYFYLVNGANSKSILDFFARYCDIQIVFENYGVPLIEVYFYFDDEEILAVGYRADNDLYTLSSVRCFGNDYYQPSIISSFSLALGFQEVLDLRFCADLSNLLLGGNKVVFPRQEYLSYNEAWSAGKNQAITLERNAYDAGLSDGTGDYQKGYDEGKREGYNEAVREIDSGEYGEMLLGNAFSGPIRALKQVELISWTTQAGKEISISLMTVFSGMVGISLFVWFLKLFAGG